MKTHVNTEPSAPCFMYRETDRHRIRHRKHTHTQGEREAESDRDRETGRDYLMLFIDVKI